MSGTIAPRPPNAPAKTPGAPNSEVLIPEPEAPGALGKFTGRTGPKAPPKPTPWVDVVSRGPARVFFNKIFLLTVLLPTVLSIVYYGFVASDVYVSESRFVVRTPQRAQQTSVIGALLQGTGFQRAQDDSFSVHDFMASRDALKALDDKLQLKAAFSNPALDPLSRFPGPLSEETFEELFKHYTKHVKVAYDQASSITTLTVRAYTAEDAYRINSELLAMGETLVNQINERGQRDLVRFAAAEVAEAEAKAKAAAVAVANYRSRRAVFDPERQSALQLQQVTKLQDEVISAKLQLAQLRALSPANPQIPTLERRVRGLETEMAREMAKVAGGGSESFAEKATDFERLQLERTFADRQVASALTNLETARSEARRQQLYLERIVQPNTPDEAIEPRRLRAILATYLVGLVCWGVFSMLLAGIKEHRD